MLQDIWRSRTENGITLHLSTPPETHFYAFHLCLYGIQLAPPQDVRPRPWNAQNVLNTNFAKLPTSFQPCFFVFWYRSDSLKSKLTETAEKMKFHPSHPIIKKYKNLLITRTENANICYECQIQLGPHQNNIFKTFL